MATRSYSRRENYNRIGKSSAEKLDDDFDSFVESMKPFVLKLTRKSERQRIAIWIKKLCEPPGSSLLSRKNRNMYAQVLLSMLKRDLIEEPFSQHPDSGPLPTMPAYMSIYADDPTVQTLHTENEESCTPSWIRGELDVTQGDDQENTLPDQTNLRKISSNKRMQSTMTYLSEANDNSFGESHSSESQLISKSPYQTKRNSAGTTRYEPVYLQEIFNGDPMYSTSTPTKSLLKENASNGSHLSFTRGKSSYLTDHEDEILQRLNRQREVESRSKLIEARFHEDKLKIQQQHDLSVQKILDRKNSELEEVKAKCRSKLTEVENRLTKQDKKIVQQARELETLREQRSKNIVELRNLEKQRGLNNVNDFEKKLHDKMAEYEQEKFEMQKKHTQEIQEILEETNTRIGKIENENKKQVEGLNKVVKTLELEVQKLSDECQSLQRDCRVVECNKAELDKQLKVIQSERNNLKESVANLEQEKNDLIKKHEVNIEILEKKARDDLAHEKNDKEKALAESSSRLSEMNHKVNELEQMTKMREQEKQHEIQQLASVHRQEKNDVQYNFENKIRQLEDELNQVRREDGARISELETLLREKNDDMQSALNSHREIEQENEKMMAEMKRNMEETTKKMFDDAKIQMNKVEEDLEKSRTSREKQAKEFTRQIENERMRHEKLVSELKISFEQEKTFLIREHQHDKEVLSRECEREKELLCEKQQGKHDELETQYRNKAVKDNKTITELQQMNVSLRDELVQKEGLYKQQLVELGLLREEEKQTFKRQYELQAGKLSSEKEQERLELQRQYSNEVEQILDKTNSRMKQMEEEYIGRTNKMQEITDALRVEIQSLKDEKITYVDTQEKRFNGLIHRQEEEIESLKNHHSTLVKSLERDIERQKTLARDADKQRRNVEIKMQEKISKLQYEYEERMNSLLPREMKEQLEDTIRSLRQQVSILQSRADILQEELDSTDTLSSTWDMSRLEKHMT